MGLVIPVLDNKCCCCGCPGGAGHGSGGGSGLLVPGAGAVGIYGGVPLDFSVGGVGGGRQPVVGAPPGDAALAERVRQAKTPVWVASVCGGDRDCISDERSQPSYDDAVAGSEGWLNKAPSRFVRIYDRPGGLLLTQLGPRGAAAAPVAAPTSATERAAVEQQRRQFIVY